MNHYENWLLCIHGLWTYLKIDVFFYSSSYAMTDVTKKLLTDYDLMIAGKPHNIVEVEMYLHSAEHPDPYVHGYSEQELPNV